MVFLGSVGFLTAFQREFRLSGGGLGCGDPDSLPMT